MIFINFNIVNLGVRIMHLLSKILDFVDVSARNLHQFHWCRCRYFFIPLINLYIDLLPVTSICRWTCLLEEIAERLRGSKALLQLWQRYKKLYEQSCCSIQLQEEKADKLLKLACSKDIADEEVSDWIQECSVSEATAASLFTHSTSEQTFRIEISSYVQYIALYATFFADFCLFS